MKKNQNGFGLIEGLIITIVLAIVGFGSYYVWHNHHTTANNSATSIATTQTSPTTQAKVQTFFDCLANKGSLSKKKPAACLINGKNYPFPTTFTTNAILNYDKAPSGVQPQIVALARENFDGCLPLVKSGYPESGFPLTTVTFAANNFVTIDVENCDSGFSKDFGLQGTSWNDLGDRQEEISCSYVAQYNLTQSGHIAGSIHLETECINSDGSTEAIPK